MMENELAGYLSKLLVEVMLERPGKKELVENEQMGSANADLERRTAVSWCGLKVEDGVENVGAAGFDGMDGFEGFDGFDGCGDLSKLENLEQRDDVAERKLMDPKDRRW